jgi:hypothetical protein
VSKFHTCYTSDGYSVGCFCERGVDHDEAHFGIPQEDDDDDDS